MYLEIGISNNTPIIVVYSNNNSIFAYKLNMSETNSDYKLELINKERSYFPGKISHAFVDIIESSDSKIQLKTTTSNINKNSFKINVLLK